MRKRTTESMAMMLHQPASPALGATLLDNSVLDVPCNPAANLPLSEDLAFMREALGGQLVAGARTMIAGSPGAGKSRLASQICLDLAVQGIRSLTILTEERSAQLKRRAIQMSADWKKHDARRAMGLMQVEDGVPSVAMLPKFLMREILSPAGRYYGVKLIVLDSIQSHGLNATSTKTYRRVSEFASMCEANGITTIMLCHVTKRGDVAGPKALEHSFDTNIILRRAMLYSLLAVRKNRYGPLLLKPMPLRIDPVSIRLEPAPHHEPKPAMARTFAGAASGAIEMQAAVTVPEDSSRGRLTAPGLPKHEIQQLLGCIAGMPDMEFGDLDYTIQCRLPGSGVYMPMFGLPLCMALIGSYLQHSIPTENLYLGEIDLFRAVRPVPPNTLIDLKAAIDCGDRRLKEQLMCLGIFREKSGHEHLTGSVVFPILDEHGNVAQMYGRKITPGLREGTPLHLYLPGGLPGCLIMPHSIPTHIPFG